MIAALLALVALVVSFPASGVTFADGAVHVIDGSNSYPFDPITTVADGPGGSGTTLVLVEGGCLGCDPNVNGDLSVNGSSVATILGGVIGDDITADDYGRVELSGGSFGGSLAVVGSATVVVTGYGFNLPLGDVLASSGFLTGYLADGMPLSATFSRLGAAATITLVPEPSTALLLGLGFAAMSSNCLRRKA